VLTTELRTHFDQLVRDHEVVLFMKGRRRMPQCGFSARVVNALDELLEDYLTVNVLEDPAIREGIKEYTNWPTIPQLYVKGKFVGGCDIVLAMFENGELHQLFGREAPKVEAPALHITDAAKAALVEALASEKASHVRFTIDAQWRCGLDLDTPSPDDLAKGFSIVSNGVSLYVDRGTAKKANGVRIDFIPGDTGGFKIDNPNEPARVRVITPAELAARLGSGEKLELYDVRTEQERAIARIDGARMLDQAAAQHIESLDKESTVLVFHCHKGQRSMAAAQHFLQHGFQRVYNLRGGIDAWSAEVDPKVPRY
jgi:monothiol glutaredoxin